MKKTLAFILLFALLSSFVCMSALSVFAEDDNNEEIKIAANDQAVENEDENKSASKVWPVAVIIGVAAAVGALCMAFAISKSAESISRQPEAAGKISSNLMLGLVFIETCIIYALIIAILVIFVL